MTGRLAKRYARAVFELARDEGTLEALGEELARRGLVEPVDAGDAVPGREDHPGFPYLQLFLELLDLIADDVADFGSADLHQSPLQAVD